MSHSAGKVVGGSSSMSGWIYSSHELPRLMQSRASIARLLNGITSLSAPSTVVGLKVVSSVIFIGHPVEELVGLFERCDVVRRVAISEHFLRAAVEGRILHIC